jgi:hypothetical protein
MSKFLEKHDAASPVREVPVESKIGAALKEVPSSEQQTDVTVRPSQRLGRIETRSQRLEKGAKITEGRRQYRGMTGSHADIGSRRLLFRAGEVEMQSYNTAV